MPLVTYPRYKRLTGHIVCDDSKARKVLGYKSRPLDVMLQDSHHLDTLYIVIKGGKIQTIHHPADEGCPNVLLKKYGIAYRLQLLWAKIRKKPLPLVDGFAFYMPSATKTVVHKAIASSDNQEAMVLLGIEFSGS
jgi:hypothetical protein